jgi:LmbE family N-acetylglucosaminyl deacetylase
MTSLQHYPTPQVVLAVAAHPDDIEYMAGGTLATWSDQGCEIHYLIVTDGSGGSRDPHQDQVALAAQRRREQMAAANVLGVASVTFLGRRDAELEPSLDLRVAIARVIRQTRPDAVLTFDPHMLYRAATINHPDHVVVGASTLGAVMPLANTCLAAPALRAEGLEPHDVRALYLFEPAAPSHWMPLTAQVVARKIAALREHASQLALWDGEGCVYQRARATAQIAATRGVRCAFAEDYARIQLAADGEYTGLPWMGSQLNQSPFGLLARSLQTAASGIITTIRGNVRYG